MTAPRKPRLVGRPVFLCLADMRSGPRDPCPDPLPSSYMDAGDAAARRLDNGWECAQCPDCGRYGWRPGEPIGEACDERVPALGADAAR